MIGRRDFVRVAASLPLLSLAGCAGSSLAQGAPIKKNGPWNLAFVCTILDSEYWQRCVEGVAAGDVDFNAHTSCTGPTSQDDFATAIVDYLRDAIDTRPDGILVYAGIEGLRPLIQEAADKNIPVVAVDSDDPKSARVAYVGIDASATGRICAERILELTGGKAVLGVLVSSFSAKHEAEKLEGAREAFGGHEVVEYATAECGSDVESSYQTAKALLAANPEVTALLTTASFVAAGAARAKVELGRDDIVLVGYDDDDENIAFLRRGVIDALVVQNPYQMGYLGVDVLAKYLKEGELKKDFYDTGVTLVTQENVDSYLG